MNKKLISFVQPNFQQGPRDLNAFYLPYSSGVIWSYALSSEFIKENYQLDTFIWRRDPLADVVNRLADNDVIAFSTYIWNHNYNYKLAEQLKKINPNIVIIVGGPEPAITDKEFFKKYPFIDIVVKLEGEITFRNILENLGSNLLTIPGLLINRNGETVDTGDSVRIDSLSDIPSPYLIGLFDGLIKDNPGVEWNATLETNRGCPYQCTFCDWGSLTYSKVKKFELGRVFEEIEWFGKNRCGYISLTDANFGMFYERDSIIADKIIEVQNKNNGFPKTYGMSWAKNQKKEVIDIAKKLINSKFGYNNGLTVSIQSLDDNVLENIRRRNMEFNKIEEVNKLCEKNNIPTYTELILGLPGETADTWRENFWKLFRNNNHHGITVYQAQMLENAEMNLLQRRLYKIETVAVKDYFSSGYSNNEEIEETINVVTSTKDMPLPMMIESSVFTSFLNAFHVDGISTFLSRFVAKYCGVDYSNFYTDLNNFLQTDEWYFNQQEEMRGYYTEWLTNGELTDSELAGIQIKGLNLVYRTLLQVHIENKYDHVYGLLEKFMQRYNIDEELLNDLFVLQRNYLVVHNKVKLYPLKLSFNYNIYDYIVFDQKLTRKNTDYTLDFPEDKDIKFQTFLEKIYFARRRNYGKAVIKTNDEI